MNETSSSFGNYQKACIHSRWTVSEPVVTKKIFPGKSGRAYTEKGFLIANSNIAVIKCKYSISRKGNGSDRRKIKLKIHIWLKGTEFRRFRRRKRKSKLKEHGVCSFRNWRLLWRVLAEMAVSKLRYLLIDWNGEKETLTD